MSAGTADGAVCAQTHEAGPASSRATPAVNTGSPDPGLGTGACITSPVTPPHMSCPGGTARQALGWQEGVIPATVELQAAQEVDARPQLRRRGQ